MREVNMRLGSTPAAVAVVAVAVAAGTLSKQAEHSGASPLLFENGQKVIIIGLIDAVNRNGKCGEIVSWVSEKERYEVRVEGEEKNILIRPNNLEVKSNAQQRDFFEFVLDEKD